MEKILIADHEAEYRSHVVQVLTEAGYQNDVATFFGEALEKATAEDYDVILLDMIMPKGSGVDCLVELKRKNPRTRIIVMTACPTIKNAVNAIKKGASEYLSKPFTVDELLMTIKRVLDEAHVEICSDQRDFHCIMSSLSNPVRSEIMRVLSVRKTARLTDISRELDIDDGTKVLCHLKELQESGIVKYDQDNIYSLTPAGERTLACLAKPEWHEL